MPVGRPGETAVYLVRPANEANWQRLTRLFSQFEIDQSRPDAWVMVVPDSAAQAIAEVVAEKTPHSFARQIQLLFPDALNTFINPRPG